MTTLFNEEPMSQELVSAPPQPVAPAELNPLVILQAAVAHGTKADELEKLMQLQERWERNQAEKAFSVAMHACQEEMPRVVKNATNNHTNTTYADLQNVQSVARPIYAKHGFSLCFGEADCPVEKFKRTVCDVTHDQGHTRRYHIDLPIDGVGGGGNSIKGMNPVQGCISTTSYGQRRLTCMIFNIVVAGEDDDGQLGDTVSEEQIATINEWIETSGAKPEPFLKFLGVESLADLPARDFDKAIKALKQVQEKNRRGGK